MQAIQEVQMCAGLKDHQINKGLLLTRRECTIQVSF